MAINNKLSVLEFYPFDFIYDKDVKVYLRDGTYLGWMSHIAQDDASRLYGRTFAHPSTTYAWGEAFGGNPSFVRDFVKITSLRNKANGAIYSRAHSGALAFSSGANVTHVSVNGATSHLVVDKTSFPTGSFTTPSIVNQSEDFNLVLNGREYNPHTSFLRYEVWVDSFYKVQEGSVDQDSVTSLNVPLILHSSGNRNVTVRLFDSVERRTDIHRTVYVNRPPVADFILTPSPSDRLTRVSFTNQASDPDGDALTYVYEYRLKGQTVWSRLSTAAAPLFTFPSVGTYEVRQTVRDTHGATATIQKDHVVNNLAPTADFTATPNPTNRITEVVLNSSATDPENDSLTYTYQYKKKDVLMKWIDIDTTGPNTTFTFPELGVYEVIHTVRDSFGARHSVTKEVVVNNIGPTANFDWNPANIYLDTQVDFINRSFDGDNDTLTYQWSYQEPGTTTWVNFSVAESPLHTFTKKGNWNIRLTVSDGLSNHSLTKVLTVLNRAPVASFTHSPSQIYSDTSVLFANTSSDIDGDSLTYQWAYQSPGSSTWVSFSTTKDPSRIFNQKGSWNVRLTVSDGSLSHSTIGVVTVQNRPPVAQFTHSPSTIYNDTTVSFTNNSSDVDGDALTYQWAYQQPGSTTWVSFSTSKDPSRVFTSKGTWNIRLTVNDGTASNSVTRSLVVSNRSPVAQFTYSPSTVYNDSNVIFTNTSTDADGDTLTYQWAYQTPGSSIWTSFSTSKDPTRTLDIKGVWNIRLTVNDGTASHSVVQSINVGNRAPVASFTHSPTTIYNNTTVNFTNASSDIDGDTLTYQWAYQAPGSSTWTNFSSTDNPSRVFSTKGTWNIRLTASDGFLSHSVTRPLVVSNRTPVANFDWNPSTIFNDTTVSFENISTDADGDTLTHQWAYQVPGSSTWVNFSTAENPSRLFATKGTWNIRLTVNDGTTSHSVIKSLNVGNRAPVANFTHSPATIYSDTTVSFTNTSTDPDGDVLSYTWSFQAPGSSTWTDFSKVKDPSRIFNSKGTWNIRLTVNDGTAAHSTVKSLVVQNRTPVAQFTHSPTTIYSNTTVSFNNTSSDPDGDTLTYQWAYQQPGSTSWVDFSTVRNPSRVFNIKGTWNIRLTVNDGTTSHAVTRPLIVSNRNPVADFSWNPTTIYNDTTVNLTNSSSDLDGDTLTYQWEYQQPGSTTWVRFSTNENPARLFAIKGSWNIRLTVNDGMASHSATKSLNVLNRPPVASITHNPAVVYKDTNVQLASNASDPDSDTLTYKWEVQKPNTTTWTQISTLANPTYTFNEKGPWTVRLTVSDGESNTSTTKIVTVVNRPPVADFSFAPNDIYTDTNVTFTNRSVDPDNDELSHQWSYQEPGSTSWVNFSTVANPSRVFNKKGTWNIRLTVNDGAATHSVTKPLTVLNTPPQVTLSYAPNLIFEGDTVTLTARPTDYDGDRMTIYFEQKVNGAWQNQKQLSNVASGTVVTHNFVASPGNYEWRVRAVDSSNAAATAAVTFSAVPLEIVGKVSHTPEWEAIHAENNHETSQFFSGETFLNHATVTNHTISEVTVTFIGEQVNGQTMVLQETMTSMPHPQYSAEIYDEAMMDSQTKLANGMVEFVFEAEWANGVVKRDIVTVNIVDDVYKAFDMNRTN